MGRLDNIFDDIETLRRNKCAGELFTRLLKAKEIIEKPITEHPDVQRLIIQTTKLEVENKRLKEALERIKRREQAQGGGITSDYDASRIAEQALKDS